MHYISTVNYKHVMDIRVDEAIKNGVYLDKETNTLVDNTESINLVVNSNNYFKTTKVIDIIATLLELNDSETAVYTSLIEAKTINKSTLNVAESVTRIAKLYNKSERSIYKAIKSLNDKRIITYRGINAIQLNRGYDFIRSIMNEPKFIIISLIN